MAEQAQTFKISFRKKLVRLHRGRRREKAVDYAREEIARRMHVGIDEVKIDKDLNRLLHYRSKHMHDFSIAISKDSNGIIAKPAEQIIKKPSVQASTTQQQSKEEKKK